MSNFSDAYASFYALLEKAFPMPLLATIGVAFMVLGLALAVFDYWKNKNFKSAFGARFVGPAALIGLLFVAPAILIPAFLGFMDLLVGALFSIWDYASSNWN